MRTAGQFKCQFGTHSFNDAILATDLRCSMRAKVDKHSMRVKRRLAAWDDAYLESLVTGAG